MSNKNVKTEPKPETASGTTENQGSGTPPPVESKAEVSGPGIGAEEKVADPAPAASDPPPAPASPVAADPPPAPKAEWPQDIKIVNNTSMPLSLPGISASVPPWGGSALATVNTLDDAKRLRTDLAQLAELHRWPDDAIEITLL